MLSMEIIRKGIPYDVLCLTIMEIATIYGAKYLGPFLVRRLQIESS